MAIHSEGINPTDDEREALVAILEAPLTEESQGRTFSEMLADVILVRFGFRRSEVPEPSAATDARGKYTDAQVLYMLCLALEEGLEGVKNIDLPDVLLKMISEHWGTADEDTAPDEAEAAFAQLEPYIPDHLRTPEPQGEPSDDGHLITDCEHGVNSLYDRCAPCEAIEQGEPSDAQVRAAVNAWHRTGGTGCEDWYDNPINRERMRLALRAAGVVGQEGEQNHG